jgi:signal transduction histidine kinase
VREAIADLRTRPEPGPLGLGRALAEYVSQFGDRAGVIASFDGSAAEAARAQLPPVAEMQLLRIVQEALANVRKHASATHVSVRFWQETGNWHVAVDDDGVGFDASAMTGTERRGQFGLQMMRERAESIGGGMSIRSEPMHGTRVHAWVPARATAARRAGRSRAEPDEETARGATAAAAG